MKWEVQIQSSTGGPRYSRIFYLRIRLFAIIQYRPNFNICGNCHSLPRLCAKFLINKLQILIKILIFNISFQIFFKFSKYFFKSLHKTVHKINKMICMVNPTWNLTYIWFSPKIPLFGPLKNVTIFLTCRYIWLFWPKVSTYPLIYASYWSFYMRIQYSRSFPWTYLPRITRSACT